MAACGPGAAAGQRQPPVVRSGVWDGADAVAGGGAGGDACAAAGAGAVERAGQAGAGCGVAVGVGGAVGRAIAASGAEGGRRTGGARRGRETVLRARRAARAVAKSGRKGERGGALQDRGPRVGAELQEAGLASGRASGRAECARGAGQARRGRNMPCEVFVRARWARQAGSAIAVPGKVCWTAVTRDAGLGAAARPESCIGRKVPSTACKGVRGRARAPAILSAPTKNTTVQRPRKHSIGNGGAAVVRADQDAQQQQGNKKRQHSKETMPPARARGLRQLPSSQLPRHWARPQICESATHADDN